LKFCHFLQYWNMTLRNMSTKSHILSFSLHIYDYNNPQLIRYLETDRIDTNTLLVVVHGPLFTSRESIFQQIVTSELQGSISIFWGFELFISLESYRSIDYNKSIHFSKKPIFFSKFPELQGSILLWCQGFRITRVYLQIWNNKGLSVIHHWYSSSLIARFNQVDRTIHVISRPNH